MSFCSIGDQQHILETIIIFNYRSSKFYNSSTSIVLNETWSMHYLDDFSLGTGPHRFITGGSTLFNI
ncbi:unnamed protein product [Rotaria socialis]|uniref:Uncharacterized protein n=2 Tax=Rotaria TaxID=231623 RepID=A0A818JXZ0_9BILA|nr:unnamed protein product [Rotaria socialis]